jgi:hypothetical protein
LTGNDINSGQADQQVECLSLRAREARNMTLALRQKHLDVKLQKVGRPSRVYGGLHGRRPGSKKRLPGPSLVQPRGSDCPQFSGRLEDLREFRRCWGEYEKLYYPKEQEKILVELLHSHVLGPELRKVVSQARSLGTTWTYLED